MINLSKIPQDIWEGLELLLAAHEMSIAEFLDQVEAAVNCAPDQLRVNSPEVRRYCEAEGLTGEMWSWGEARRLLREAHCLPEDPDPYLE
jgi:hypothetical protein